MIEPPEEFGNLLQAFLDGLKTILGEKLFGAYLYGALAFPETEVLGDIDFHAILSARLTNEEKISLNDLHTNLARNYPPLGAEMDGYYLLLEDTYQTIPPGDQRLDGIIDDAWALHCAHIRSGRCIVLYGPDPKHVYPEPTWTDLVSALLSELAYIERKLYVYPDYCFLNLCRLMYSFERRDVVISKAAAAEWANERYPQWCPYIDLALKTYAKQATAQDRERMLSGAVDFFHFSCGAINECLGSQSQAIPNSN